MKPEGKQKHFLGYNCLSQHPSNHPSSPIKLIPNAHPNPSPPIPIHLHPSQPITSHPNPSQPIPTTSRVCILLGCLRMCDNASWQNFANMVSPANLTMTTRTGSKFCARSWSRDKHIFNLDLISLALSETSGAVPYPPMQRVRWSPVPSPHPGAGGRRRSP